MDIERSLTFFKDDPRWKEKAFTGTAVLIISMVLSVVLIGFLGFFIVGGYCLRLLQNVRDGNPTPLPEWDQWGDDLMRGFKLFVTYLLWAIPSLVIVIPVALGGFLSESGSGSAGEIFGGTLLFCGSCLSALYGLFFAVMMPGITIAFAEDEQISSGLQLGKIWTWTRDNIGPVVMVALVYMVASIAISLVAGLVGLLLCIIGLIVTIPLGTLATYVFQYHLFGQLASQFPMSPAPAYSTTPADSSAMTYTPPTDDTAATEVPPAPSVSPAPETPDTPDTPSTLDTSSTPDEPPSPQERDI